MKTYRWHGPVQALTIRDQGKEMRITLLPGRSVDLPEDHPVVAAWLGSGMLEEMSKPARPANGGRRKKEKDHA